MSFFVKQGNEILVFGKLTPFLDCKKPPNITFKTTVSFLFVLITSNASFPSSNRTLSFTLTSLAKLM